MLSLFNFDPKQCCFAVMLTDVGDQTFCEHCIGLGCCFCWQLVGSSVPILADVIISYCGTSAPLYIFLFLIVIFRTVTAILNEDLVHVLHSNIGHVYASFK